MNKRHPEHFLISCLLNIKDVLKAEELGLTVGHIHEYKAEYEWVTEYKIKYKNDPTWDIFLNQFPGFERTDNTDIEYAVDQVKRFHLSWAMAKVYREGSALVRNNEPEEALDFTASQIMKISTGIDATHQYGNSITDFSEHWDWTLSRATSESTVGAPFAHQTLQERTLGMQGGDLWLKAARLGQGKTWDLINDATASLIAGKNVIFFSLEMNQRQMLYRFHTVLGKKFGHKVTNDQLTKGRGLDLMEYKTMLNDLAEKVPGKLMICDRRRGRVTARTVAALVNKHSPDLAVIDYLSLMSPSGSNKFSQNWESIATIVDEVKEVACQFDIPILSAAQINRDGERGSWRPPTAVHLAGSDSLGRDADCVITMKRFGKGAMVYSLEKNRHGQSGDVWFARFDPNNGDFSEISRQEAERIRAEEGDYNDDL